MGSNPYRRIFLLGIAHPVVGPPFRYRGCTGRWRFDKTAIMKEADVCGLDNTFVQSILYKRIVTKFFWDYCLNSRVCKHGKRAVIGLLRTVIKCFIFIF